MLGLLVFSLEYLSIYRSIVTVTWTLTSVKRRSGALRWRKGRIWSLMWNSNGWCRSPSLPGTSTSYLGQYLGTSEPHVKVDWNNLMEYQRAILCLVAFWFHGSWCNRMSHVIGMIYMQVRAQVRCVAYECDPPLVYQPRWRLPIPSHIESHMAKRNSIR